MALAASQHGQRLEVRGLEQHLGRRLRHLGVLAAHHAGDPDRPLGVGDDEILGIELALAAVEGDELLAGSARRTTIRPPASFAWSNACSGLPSASIT